MEFTGERMIPEHNNEDIIYSEHLLRYNFAKQFVRNKLVLDVASGSGYGTRILADGQAKNVTGVDISEAAVKYAKEKYASKNTDFICADGTKLPFEDKQYDVVVSFETIEHLEDHNTFVNQLHRVLKDNGTLIISSPNKEIYPEGNEYHFRELTKKEFTAVLKKHFKNIKIYNQNNFLVSSLFENEKAISKSSNDTIQGLKSDGMYFVAVCSNVKLPDVQTQNLIASPNEISSQAVVHERETHIKILQAEIEELKHNIDYLKAHPEGEERIKQLDAELIRIKGEHNTELAKNEYLYNTVKEDNKRFDDVVKLLHSKEAIHQRLVDENSDFRIKFAEIEKELREKATLLENIKSEKESIESQLASLKEFEQKYKEETEKAEYLYRLSQEKESQLAATKELLENVEKDRNDYYSRLETLNGIEEQNETLILQLEEKSNRLVDIENELLALQETYNSVKEFEQNFYQERDKAEYLHNKLNETEQNLINEKENCDSLKDLVQQKDSELVQTRSRIAEIESRNSEIQARLDFLNNIESLYNEEKSKADYLYRSSVEAKEAIENLQNTNSKLNEETAKFKILKEELQLRIESASKENNDLVISLNKIIQENSSLRDTQSSFEKLRNDLLGKIELLNQEKTKLSSTVSVNEETIELLKSKCNEYEQTNNLLNGKVSELLDARRYITELQADLYDSRLVILREKEKLTIAEQKMSELNKKLKELTKLHEETKKLVEIKDSLINEKNEELQQLINSKEIELNEKENEIQILIETKERELSEREAIIDQNNNVIQHYKQEHNVNLTRIQQVEEMLANANKEKEDLVGQVDNLTSKTHLLNVQIEQNLNEIKNLRSSISWIITKPLRGIFNLLMWMLSPFKAIMRDTKYAHELLVREGLKSFIYRFFWYLRGKRLIEDIQYSKNKKEFKEQSKLISNKAEIKFERFSKPDVSIIIPVYNQWDFTYNCLNSIYENTKGISYEIIIADDVSDDDTKNITDIIKNIKVVRNKENLRFLLNCNTAAKKAKGKYVLFLNNDTTVHKDWLKYLLDTFEKHDNVGAAGGKLVFEDGRMQEAGGIMWDDASGWNFGRLGDPEMPDFNYVKESDYVSGACLMIPTKLWKELGGFDTHFVPAYYEDTDICFEIRKRGYKVLYQPKAVVTHYEGISNGTDESSGQKKYQVTNHEKFYEKWKTELKAFHFKNAENVFLARERSRNKKQILVIDHYVPHFDKDAGSRSTYSYLKLLVKMGFNVKFIGDNFFKHEPYTTELEQMGIEVLYGNHYFNNIREWIKENGKYFDYVFAHRMHIAPKYFVDLKKYSKAKIIYIGHDLQFIKSKKEYEFTKDEEHLKNYEKFKEIEGQIFNTVDIIYPFSTYEAPLIQELVPKKVVRSIPVYFFDDEYTRKNKFSQRKDILFVGGFGHPPNRDAVMWFVKEIFPLVQEEIPDVRFNIVGSNPPEEIVALQSDSINVTGFVSDEELQEFYENCKLSVLPLRVGAGVKGKLLESMYYKLPTVITPVAAEGVPGIEENCLISDNESIFAQNIVKLYNNKAEWNRYSAQGAELIKKYFTVENAEKILRKDLK